MGCCESVEQDEDNIEPSERDALLHGGSGSVESGQHGGGPGQQRSDEQSALSRILQETSNNLIDISAQALAADMTEETEAQYKAKQYSSRIGAVKVPWDTKLGSGSGKSRALNILAEPCIPLSDIDLVTEAARRTPHCMGHVKVQHKEELIVHFGVP